MRFDRVRLAHFGGLHHLDTGEESLGPLVVIQGPNESGKSTFFHFLTSMLYGFRPASPTHHPYAPWSGDEIEGEADGHLDDGGSWTVVRRLRSSPWGRLQTGGGEVELRNRTLPFVEHVPRAVFQKVFALTLHELAGLDGETWSTLQDRLLARMTMDDLRPPRDVLDELRTEANALWRPDQRGRPRARIITAEILELQRDRRAAAERDQELRRMSDALNASRIRLEEVRSRRRDARSALDRMERLLPAKRLVSRIRRFESEVDLDALAGLPSDPLGALERLRDEASARARAVSALAAEIEAARSACQEPLPTDLALLEQRDAIEARASEFESARDLRARIESRREELGALARRVDSMARNLFDPEAPAWNDEGVVNLPLSALADETVRLRNLRGDRRAHEDAVALEGRPNVGGSDRLGLLGLVGGIVLVAVGALTRTLVATTLGLVLVALAVLAATLRWDRARRAAGAPTAADLERTRAAEALSLQRIHALLGDLPLRAEIRSDPQPELIARLDALVSQVHERGERTASLAVLEERARSLEEETSRTLQRAGIVSDIAPERVLLKALADAVGRERERGQTSKEVARLEARHTHELEAVGAASVALAELENRLAPLGEGDPVRGAHAAQKGLLLAVRLEEAREELVERYVSLEDVDASAAALELELGWTVDEDTIDRLRQELATVQEQEIRLSEEVTGLERDILHLEKERTVSVLDGEIEALKDERREVLRERDRLALLGRIVEVADRRFRDRHQPDVVRRSGEYLSWITDTRYRRLTAGEGPDDGHLLLQTSAGRSIDVNGPLSTGTKEQVLLSLRLAVADHLDQTGERMPLFIDEALVNWDRGRQDRGLELVSELSRGRQVFVFTCHEHLADTLAAAGGRLVRLEQLPG